MSYPAGSLDLEPIEDALYAWIVTVTEGVFQDDDEHVQWRNQSQPLLARPVITLKWIDGPRPIARNANRFQSVSGGIMTSGTGVRQEATLSIQIFGNTEVQRPMAHQLAIDLNSSLMRQNILDQLKQAGIAVQVVGQPRNLTALEETQYEERYGFELTLGLSQNLTEETTTIGTVNAEILGHPKTIVLP